MIERFNIPQLQRVVYWVLMLIIFYSYWLFSRQYIGPAYLSDEVGYLTKAAAFAGYPVDMASSWHGGYSLLLSPLFIVFSDPFDVWQGVMVFNAFVWTLSFMLLFNLLRAFFPQRDFWAIYVATALSAVYPAWITMSGYAFSTTAFVFVFLLSISVLLKSSKENIWSIAPYSLLVGFLYWIHPTGLAVAIASFLVILGYARYSQRYAILFLHVFITVLLIAIYKIGVHQWLSSIMTPEHYLAQEHYQGLSTILKSFLHLKFWLAWGVISLGQASYLIVGTLGLCFFAVIDIWKKLINTRMGDNINTPVQVSSALAFIVLSMLGIVLLGSLSFATNFVTGTLRPDHWIYGRYSEVVLLPLFGIGFLVQKHIKSVTVAAFIVLVSGLALHLYSNESNTSSNNNLLNIQSFWPQVAFPHEDFLFWFTLGAVGIILTNFWQKRLFVVLAVPLFVASIYNQNGWHKNILSGYSKPSSLIDLVATNFNHGQCIGFDTFVNKGASGLQKERRKLYSYYFFNYDIRRMSPDEWLSSCDGPYLTYRADGFLESQEAKVVAREISSGLFLVVKSEQLNSIRNQILPSPIYDLYVNLEDNNTCLVRGCFSMQANDLNKFSQVGLYNKEGLQTISRSGYLFYGPYSSMKKGDYYIKVQGKFSHLHGASLDIVSGQGKNIHLNLVLSDYFDSTQGAILIPFTLTFDVSDIEVRIKVGPKTELSIYNYSIALNETGIVLPLGR